MNLEATRSPYELDHAFKGNAQVRYLPSGDGPNGALSVMLERSRGRSRSLPTRRLKPAA